MTRIHVIAEYKNGAGIWVGVATDGYSLLGRQEFSLWEALGGMNGFMKKGHVSRGLPEDFSLVHGNYHPFVDYKGYLQRVYMGERDYSWMTQEEIENMEWPDDVYDRRRYHDRFVRGIGGAFREYRTFERRVVFGFSGTRTMPLNRLTSTVMGA